MIVSQKDVSWLEISVNDASTINTGIPIKNFIHEGNGFSLGDLFSTGDEFGQVSTIAEFGDDVGIIFSIVDIVDFDDVFTILQYFEDVDFRGEKVLMDFSFDHLHVDDFDGDCFI